MRLLLPLLILAAAPQVEHEYRIPTWLPYYDCREVLPGSRIILEGPKRGPLVLDGCTGAPGSPIVVTNDPREQLVITNTEGLLPKLVRFAMGAVIGVRNDTTESAKLTFNTTGFMLEVRTARHVTISGLGKWSGAPAGTCGVTVASNTWTLGRTQCGIKLQASADTTHYLVITRHANDIIVQGLEFDGNENDTSADKGGIGIQVVGDSSSADVDGSANPGYFKGPFRFTQNYLHEIGTEGLYICGNYAFTGQPPIDSPRCEDVEVDHNVLEVCGWDCIEIKSTIRGSNSIHHNYVSGAGAQATTGGGALDRGISVFEGYADIYLNKVLGTHLGGYPGTGQGSCIINDIFEMVLTFDTDWDGDTETPGPFNSAIWGNELTDCSGSLGTGITVNGAASGKTKINPTISFNTIVDPTGIGINVASGTPSGSIGNNIVAKASGTMINAGGLSQANNLTGTVASIGFTNAAGNDFTLGSGSAALNAASGARPGDATDLNSRACVSTCDRGAYERP